MNHRGLQRTLFRMQADVGFAADVLKRDSRAIASTGLEPQDLQLLEGLDLSAVTADPDGKRRTQICGNAASEFTLTLAAAARRDLGAPFLDGFLSSPEFHSAIANDDRLPFAFAVYAGRYAVEAQAPDLGALVKLEEAMAWRRRIAIHLVHTKAIVELESGDVLLSPYASTTRLPAGTYAWAGALRTALNGERAAPDSALDLDVQETLLVLGDRPRSVHRLPNVRVELLQHPVDDFFDLATSPVTTDSRAAFARSKGAEPADLERFLESYVSEGVLLRGR